MEKLPFELSGFIAPDDIVPGSKVPISQISPAEKNLKSLVALMENLQQKRVDNFLYSVNLEISQRSDSIKTMSECTTSLEVYRNGKALGELNALLLCKELFTKIFVKND